jgi:hypothetical protein
MQKKYTNIGAGNIYKNIGASKNLGGYKNLGASNLWMPKPLRIQNLWRMPKPWHREKIGTYRNVGAQKKLGCLPMLAQQEK